MNLDLPFAEDDAAALDAFVASIDRELDALFLDEVEAALRCPGADRDVPPDLAVA